MGAERQQLGTEGASRHDWCSDGQTKFTCASVTGKGSVVGEVLSGWLVGWLVGWLAGVLICFTVWI